MPPRQTRVHASARHPPTIAAMAPIATNVTYHGDSAIRSCIGLRSQSVNLSWIVVVRSERWSVSQSLKSSTRSLIGVPMSHDSGHWL